MKNQKGFGVIEGLLAIIAVTLIVGVGFYVVNSNKEKPAEQSQVAAIEKKEEPTPETKQEVPELIEYEPPISIQSTQDIVKLERASESFKNYMRSLTSDFPEFPGEGCDNPQTISISKIVNDEFALGGVGACAGARFVWKKTNETWSSVDDLAGQAAVDCSAVIKHKVPASIIERCYDENNPNAGDYGIIPNPNN